MGDLWKISRGSFDPQGNCMSDLWKILRGSFDWQENGMGDSWKLSCGSFNPPRKWNCENLSGSLTYTV